MSVYKITQFPRRAGEKNINQLLSTCQISFPRAPARRRSGDFVRRAEKWQPWIIIWDAISLPISPRDLIADIAKGRYGKEKVMEIMEAAATEAAHAMERRVTEFLLLHFAQVMHYELGFGKQRLERYINDLAEQMAAFDAGAYDIDDMRQALIDDAKFELELKWTEEEGNVRL